MKFKGRRIASLRRMRRNALWAHAFRYGLRSWKFGSRGSDTAWSTQSAQQSEPIRCKVQRGGRGSYPGRAGAASSSSMNRDAPINWTPSFLRVLRSSAPS
jgi:hypothetical protein